MASRSFVGHYEFECNRCGTVQKAQANIVPKKWAVLTTFNDESAKYYYCVTCKELILRLYLISLPSLSEAVQPV